MISSTTRERRFAHGEQGGLLRCQRVAARLGETGGVGRGEGDPEALEGETDRGDDVHALAHEVVAQLDLEQVALLLLGGVLDGREQDRIDPRQAGDHVGVALVALADARVDGPELARIGHQHLMAEVLEKAADPRAVGSDLQRDAAVGILLREPPETLFVVGDGTLLDDFARRVENADGVFLVAQVEPDGDGWNGVFHVGSGVGWNDVLHVGVSLSRRASAAGCLLI